MEINPFSTVIKINLSAEVHELLKRKGYEYLQITDLELNKDKQVCALIVKALRTLPASLQHSCTSIDDPMIAAFINKVGVNCDIFIEPFEVQDMNDYEHVRSSYPYSS
jgi:hypothetical protein